MRRSGDFIRTLGIAAVLLSLTACSSESILLPTWAPPTLKEAKAQLAGLPFDEFANAAFRIHVLRHPQTAYERGLSEALGVRDDRLDDHSDAYLKETEAIERETYRCLQTYDRQALDADDRLTYDACEWMWGDLIACAEQRFSSYPISASDDSPHARLYARLISTWRLRDEEDVVDYVACLHQADQQLLQVRQRLLALAKAGDPPPQEALDRVLGELIGLKITEMWSRSVYLPDRIVAGHHPFFIALRSRLLEMPSIGVERRVAYLAEAKKALEEEVIPAYEELYDAIVSVLSGETRTDIGLAKRPGGAVSYATLLHHYTESDWSAEQVHAAALAAVERGSAEIAAVEDDIRMPSGRDASDVVEAASWGASAATLEEVVAEYRSAIAVATAAVAAVTHVVPTGTVDVVFEDGLSRYVPASSDGERPATLVVSSSDVSAPRLPLVHREVVPGTHLRIQAARTTDLPAIRAWGEFPGLAEGWATYAVDLASEIGLYRGDPLGTLGRLRAQLAVAVRAAIDTGIHSQDWSFDHAVDYYVETLGESEAAGQAVVKQCISAPGRATSALVGEIRLLSLRDEAQRAQGESFDLVAFHDALLKAGNLPLSVIEPWIRGRGGGAVPLDGEVFPSGGA